MKKLITALLITLFIFTVVEASFFHILHDSLPEDPATFICRVKANARFPGKPLLTIPGNPKEICENLLLLMLIQISLLAGSTAIFAKFRLLYSCSVKAKPFHFVYFIFPKALSPPSI